MRRLPICVVLTAALLAALMNVGCKSQPRIDPPMQEQVAQGDSGDFDYYLLALSWAPNFCATHSGPANECGSGRHVTFVVHGLWPQAERGRLDEPCQHTSPVGADVVRYALNFYPDAGLVQHEWECHGVYSGLSAGDYFAKVGKAYQSVQVPAAISGMTADTEVGSADLVRQFERANTAPEGSFVTSCRDGELVAVEACFTKDLKLRRCSGAQHGCSGELLVRAPR